MTLTQSQLMHLKNLSKRMHKMDFYETPIKAMLILLKVYETPTIEKLSYLYKNGFINDSCLCYYFISELYPDTTPEEFKVVLKSSKNNLGLKDFLIKNYNHALALFLQESEEKGPTASRLEHVIKACFTLCVIDFENFIPGNSNNLSKILMNLNSLNNHLDYNYEIMGELGGTDYIGDLIYKSIFQFANNNTRKISMSYFLKQTHITYFPDISLDLLDNSLTLRKISSTNSLEQPSILICSSEDNLHQFGNPDWNTSTINFTPINTFVKNLNNVNGYPRILICFYNISYKKLLKALSSCFIGSTIKLNDLEQGITFDFNIG